MKFLTFCTILLVQAMQGRWNTTQDLLLMKKQASGKLRLLHTRSFIYCGKNAYESILTYISTKMLLNRSRFVFFLLSLWQKCDQIVRASWPKCNFYYPHCLHVTCKMSRIHVTSKSICLILWKCANNSKVGYGNVTVEEGSHSF